MKRRTFLSTTLLGAAGVMAGCAGLGPLNEESSGSVRLTARPGTPSLDGPLGLRRLGIGAVADGSIYVPASYSRGVRAPLVLLLHGAGGSAAQFITRRIPEADQTGQIVLAVDSQYATWDAVSGSPGPDAPFIDAALKDTFARYSVDPARVSVAGFSDGATMSLLLGLANGDLLTHVVAWSPGFLIDTHRIGTPAFFISHGTADPVLPIAATSRLIVPELRREGYAVDYREFDGMHEVPSDVLHDSMVWMAGTPT